MDIYNTQKMMFIDFVNQSNQKEIISKNIIEKIQNRNKTDLIITDIGAGNGIIANKIIHYLYQNKIKYQYHFIEPSKELIDDFIKQYGENKNIIIKNNKIEEIGIFKSDVIILSFVIHLIPDIENFIQYIYEKLNYDGFICIVNQSFENIDNKLKTILGQQILDYTIDIIKILNKYNINYIFEKKKSYFDGYEDIITQTQKGKDYISLMTLTNVKLIPKNKMEEIVEVIKNNQENGMVVRSEDYIFIQKN